MVNPIIGVENVTVVKAVGPTDVFVIIPTSTEDQLELLSLYNQNLMLYQVITGTPPPPPMMPQAQSVLLLPLVAPAHLRPPVLVPPTSFKLSGHFSVSVTLNDYYD